MNSPEISARVLQFVAENIDTVPQLEALLQLWKDPHRAWSPSDIAARIYVAAEDAPGILQALVRRRLVIVESDPPLYRYSSIWDPSGDVMTEVAAEYARNLVRIATLIHSGGSSAVREFARAFDLKKER